MDESRRYRIIFLGAGFSKPAGLPLGIELWQEIRARAEVLSGRGSKFHDDLETYQAFRRDCDGLDIGIDQVDFEEFLGFLDVEFFLGLRGGDTWSDDGNETQVLIKTLIGEILAERTPQPSDIPDIYLEFARRLQSDDLILTFNYDVLLERALERVGKPYRLFPSRYSAVHQYHAEVDGTRNEVILLKVHGSIDWFDRRRYLERVAARAPVGLPTDDPIFERTDIITEPLVDGPRFPNDPLQELHRVRNIERVYRTSPRFLATPWLLTPSTMKVIYTVRDFWRDLGGAGTLNLGMAIIGFSLPPHDEYARQVLYRMVRNYQRKYWDEEIIGHRKTPLVLVDYRPSDPPRDDFRQRYAFIDWNKAACYFDGFTPATLAAVFAEK
jgi:SIR2-like domain